MNVLNRILAVLLALALIVVGVWFLVAPFTALGVLDDSVSVIVSDLSTGMIVAGAVALVGFIVLLVELIPSGRGSFVATLPEGTVEYGHRTLVDVLQRELDDIPGVREARVSIGGSGRRVDTRVHLLADGSMDTRDLASRAGGRIREALERLNLSAGTLRFSVEEPRGIRRTERRPFGRARAIPARERVANEPISRREVAEDDEGHIRSRDVA
jgi:hypothetical protein